MRTFWLLLLLVASSLATASCEAIGNIFQAGFWAGTIVVVIIVIGVLFLVSRMRR